MKRNPLQLLSCEYEVNVYPAPYGTCSVEALPEFMNEDAVTSITFMLRSFPFLTSVPIVFVMALFCSDCAACAAYVRR